MWATELWIPRLLRQSRCATHDWRDAHFFLVPFFAKVGDTCRCCRCMPNTPPTPVTARTHLPPPSPPPPPQCYSHNMRDTLSPARLAADLHDKYERLVAWLRATQPAWNRSGGADHIFIFPSGRGATLFQNWETHIANSIFWTPEGSWSEEWFAEWNRRPYFNTCVARPHRHAVRVPRTHMALFVGCRWKDMVIPGYVMVPEQFHTIVKPLADRKWLLYFRGDRCAPRGPLISSAYAFILFYF